MPNEEELKRILIGVAKNLGSKMAELRDLVPPETKMTLIVRAPDGVEFVLTDDDRELAGRTLARDRASAEEDRKTIVEFEHTVDRARH